MKNLKYSVFFKVFTIFIITLLLLIPTSMIHSLISERENTQNNAIFEVSSKWGEAQTIQGPFISVPYIKYVKEISKKDSVERIVQVKEYFHLLPSKLQIQGELSPEKRYRSIYEIVVYQTKMQLKGEFDVSEIATLDIPISNIQWEKAEFVIGLDDLRGIEEQVDLQWNGSNFSFQPGVSSNDVVSSGIHADVELNVSDSTKYSFDLNLDIKGSQMLYFTPVGKVTDVSIASPWATPSFNGAFLPDTREVSNTGFSANWNVLHLNRNFPQLWVNDRYKMGDASFGVDLLLPVDSYQKSYRTIQYVILFIGFTFLVFFFIEVLHKVFIHPIQYILVGVALLVFFTLLLSISEHLNFNLAFIISAVSTLLLIAGYVKAILKSNLLTVVLTGILFFLYTFIFVIIQLEDFALLIGSIGIFIILSVGMYLSRKIDWYQLQLGNSVEKSTEND
ncbi:MAG: cell envelope integrity protein CreD [Flavobacterium sp.]